MFTTPTVEELTELYLSLAKSKDQDGDITEYKDYWAKARATGGMGARLALDASVAFNAVYPQNGNSFGINSQLSAKGVPSQYPASPTLLTCQVQDIPLNETYDIKVGTTLIAEDGQVYSVISPDGIATVVQISTLFTTLQLLSYSSGSSTTQEIGTKLVFSPPQLPVSGENLPITETEVISMVAGQDEESVPSTINRLIQLDQVPKNGSRSTDFAYLAVDIPLGVTHAVVLGNNKLKYTDPIFKMAVFDAGGTEVTDAMLNKGLVVGTQAQVFNRSVPSGVYNQTQQKLINEDIIGAYPLVCNTVSTYGLTTLANPLFPFFKIQVQLQSGYTLQSTATVDNITFTIKQLIQREVRRAICSQPFGAALEQDLSTGEILSSSLPVSAIEQQLDYSLGTPTSSGLLGNFLANRSVLVYNGTNYGYVSAIALPLGIPTVATESLAWVYDISLDPSFIYSNIGVELV